MRTGTMLVLALAAIASLTGKEQPASISSSEPAVSFAAIQEAPTDPRDVVFAPKLGVDLDKMELQSSGLYLQVLKHGRGPQAAEGDRMWINYTVWFPDGTKLDSSLDREPPSPYKMILGRTQLIDGWNEGVTGMQRGETRLLVLPYDLAYGKRGRPPQVPSYMTLVFEVELAEHVPAGGR